MPLSNNQGMEKCNCYHITVRYTKLHKYYMD